MKKLIVLFFKFNMDFKMYLNDEKGQKQRYEGQDIIKTDQIGFKSLWYY